jgi:hypothetical protein
MDDSIRRGPAEVLNELSPEFRGRIKSEILPGEPILRAARPDPRPPAIGRGDLVPAAVVAFIWCTCGLCLAGYFDAFGRTFREFELSLALLGLFAGLFGFFGTLALVTSWSSERAKLGRIARELYVLTDRRAIIWRAPRVEKPGQDAEDVEIHSIDRGEVGHIHRVESSKGFGDIQLSLCGKIQGTFGPSLCLEGIFLVRRVEDLVRATLIGPTPPPEDA